MKIRNIRDVPGTAMGPGLPGVMKQVLIGPGEGAANFVMRRFILEKDAATPFHDHDWEHEIYVVEGQGALVSEDGEQPLRTADTVFVPVMVKHQVRNKGPERFSFLCIVPMKGEK